MRTILVVTNTREHMAHEDASRCSEVDWPSARGKTADSNINGLKSVSSAPSTNCRLQTRDVITNWTQRSQILGQNSNFWNQVCSILKPFYHLFACKLGLLRCPGRLKVVRKTKNSPYNVEKLAKNPIFGVFFHFSLKRLIGNCWKSHHM